MARARALRPPNVCSTRLCFYDGKVQDHRKSAEDGAASIDNLRARCAPISLPFHLDYGCCAGKLCRDRIRRQPSMLGPRSRSLSAGVDYTTHAAVQPLAKAVLANCPGEREALVRAACARAAELRKHKRVDPRKVAAVCCRYKIGCSPAEISPRLRQSRDIRSAARGRHRS